MDSSLERIFERVASVLTPENASKLCKEKESVISSLRFSLHEEGILKEGYKQKKASAGSKSPKVHQSTSSHRSINPPQNDFDHDAPLEVAPDRPQDSNVQEAACTRTGRVCILNDFTSSLVNQRQAAVANDPPVVLPQPRSTGDMFFDSESLVIGSYSEQYTDSVRAIPKLASIQGGRENEVLAIYERILSAKYKEILSLAPFPVRGSGKPVGVWVDDEKVSHSKEFYLTLMKDFLKQCKTPAAVIWYSGHGEDTTGNWCFRDGTICFREIFHLYQAHFKHKLLYIISDCSYSGCWIHDMACMLDDMGIPPCGHHTREQGILLKLWTSCHCSKKETFVRYVMEDVSIDNDGILIRRPQKMDELRYRPFLHTTIVTCPSKDFNCCTLDEQAFLNKWKKWKYRAQDLGSLLYLVRGKDKGKPAWHYVMIEPVKLNMFKEQVSSGTVDVSKFGEILISGWGKDPQEDVKCVVNSFF